ncbi:MAG: FHA domain-containing protein [Rhodopirellula sp.]|nr:FHA domain-containing protein [Rhodopirellula sp.]
MPFRPIRRAPMALLCVVDDGGDGGEWFRIRGPEIVVGRDEGDIRIPQDNALSGRHFKLARISTNGRFTWQLTDLQSTNGTFVRVAAALLQDEQEILIGSRRFRFEAPRLDRSDEMASASSQGSPARKTTQGWQTLSASSLGPATATLVELTAGGEGRRIALRDREQWIGADGGRCTVIVSDDPFVSKQHAKLFCDDKGRWNVKDGKSRNGTWLRVQQIQIRSTAELQAGEQRFLVRIFQS